MSNQRLGVPLSGHTPESPPEKSSPRPGRRVHVGMEGPYGQGEGPRIGDQIAGALTTTAKSLSGGRPWMPVATGLPALG
jgi:hypothetical protein